MLARNEIVSILAGVLPAGIDVKAYADNIDPPLAPTVMVRIDKVRPSRTAGYLWDIDAALVLVAAQTYAGPGDDELDAALADVLAVLDRDDVASSLAWGEATRATYGPTDGDPTNPAYEITVAARVNRTE
jgi:hypothetical protein